MRTLGPQRIAAMGVVALVLFAFLAFMALRFTTPVMAPLYTELSLDDSSAILAELDADGIAYELRNNGATVLVPEAEVVRLRMRLAETGLPNGGGVGYEIFDETDALGTTSFVQNVNHLRALEGELGRSIRTIAGVEAARVHLVLPERQLFRRDAEEPTASIALRTRGELDAGQIRAIQHLVASAVPGLQPARISIVDETGRLLAAGSEEDETLTGAAFDDRTEAFQRRLKTQIEEIVESVVGPGRTRVEVSAELDFNRITEVSETFDPESQVVRSTQTREEQSNSTEPSGEMTAGNEIPNGGDAAPTPGPSDASTATEEVVNYEISRVNKTEVVEGGRVARLSVAVLVDGSYVTGADGSPAYAPRSEDEIQRITALVRTAMGYDAERGDQVEVVNLPFATPPESLPLDAPEPGLFDFTRDELVRLAELVVLGLVSLLVLLVVVRPLVRRILGDAPPALLALPAPASGGAVQEVFPGVTVPAVPALTDAGAPPSRFEEARALAARHSGQIGRVGELVTENPSEAALIIRNWLTEAA